MEFTIKFDGGALLKVPSTKGIINIPNSGELAPFLVGKTVYYFCETFGGTLPYFVENLNIAYLNENENVYTYVANCVDNEKQEFLDSIDFDPDDIGKTVFLTKEDAEKSPRFKKGE